MALTLTGIQPNLVGDTVDMALGYPDPVTGIVNMVGYCITNAGQWQESTNLQDEEHLVQIASPSSSDRFGRYPQVSQGDWSGGERQDIFITANQFWSSTQLNTTIPGHLTINGSYQTLTIPNGINPMPVGQPVLPRTVAANERRLYFLGLNGTTYYISVYNLGTGNIGTQVATGMGAVSELMRNADFPCYVGAANGIWAVGGSGTTITITPQVVDDPVQVLNGASMATFAGSVYYFVGTTPPNEINAATYPLPGAAGGTTVFTTQTMEVYAQVITRGATGLVFTTGRGNGIDQYVYGFDGVNANYLGRIEGNILDACEANGTVYVLTAAIPALTNPQSPSLPVIYSIAGSTLSIFDDFRRVDPNFWPVSFSPGGHIESDGAYLYLFYSGLSTKRYLLTTSAVMDVGNPICVNAGSTGRAGTPLGDGGFVETEPNTSQTTAYMNVEQDGPTVNGSLITSWFDFDVPIVRKGFPSIEFVMNSAVDPSAISVAYETDLSGGFQPLTTSLSIGQDTLICYLPLHTVATRIRFQITLNSGANDGPPDVQFYVVFGKLTRVWQVTVACRHEQGTRTQAGMDAQNLTPQQLLANIQNAYDLASGNVVLYIPDPTIDQTQLDAGNGVALGVSQVTAVLQDYQRTSGPGTAPGFREDPTSGTFFMESDVQLTLSGSLSA